ncbi:MAG: hypothetical protein SGJ27_27715 [Candidatus Melainabacteria bacterium]|nr:hypothetical protein [Candidatus Melainabacteria bacterium]
MKADGKTEDPHKKTPSPNADASERLSNDIKPPIVVRKQDAAKEIPNSSSTEFTEIDTNPLQRGNGEKLPSKQPAFESTLGTDKNGLPKIVRAGSASFASPDVAATPDVHSGGSRISRAGVTAKSSQLPPPVDRTSNNTVARGGSEAPASTARPARVEGSPDKDTGTIGSAVDRVVHADKPDVKPDIRLKAAERPTAPSENLLRDSEASKPIQTSNERAKMDVGQVPSAQPVIKDSGVRTEGEKSVVRDTLFPRVDSRAEPVPGTANPVGKRVSGAADVPAVRDKVVPVAPSSTTASGAKPFSEVRSDRSVASPLPSTVKHTEFKTDALNPPSTKSGAVGDVGPRTGSALPAANSDAKQESVDPKSTSRVPANLPDGGVNKVPTSAGDGGRTPPRQDVGIQSGTPPRSPLDGTRIPNTVIDGTKKPQTTATGEGAKAPSTATGEGAKSPSTAAGDTAGTRVPAGDQKGVKQPADAAVTASAGAKIPTTRIGDAGTSNIPPRDQTSGTKQPIDGTKPQTNTAKVGGDKAPPPVPGSIKQVGITTPIDGKTRTPTAKADIGATKVNQPNDGRTAKILPPISGGRGDSRVPLSDRIDPRAGKEKATPQIDPGSHIESGKAAKGQRATEIGTRTPVRRGDNQEQPDSPIRGGKTGKTDSGNRGDKQTQPTEPTEKVMRVRNKTRLLARNSSAQKMLA